MTAPRTLGDLPPPYMYRVIERVEFDYVWEVESLMPLTEAEIRDKLCGRGDGEAVVHAEGKREILSIVAYPAGREAARR